MVESFEPLEPFCFFRLVIESLSQKGAKHLTSRMADANCSFHLFAVIIILFLYVYVCMSLWKYNKKRKDEILSVMPNTFCT